MTGCRDTFDFIVVTFTTTFDHGFRVRRLAVKVKVGFLLDCALIAAVMAVGATHLVMLVKDHGMTGLAAGLPGLILFFDNRRRDLFLFFGFLGRTAENESAKYGCNEEKLHTKKSETYWSVTLFCVIVTNGWPNDRCLTLYHKVSIFGGVCRSICL